MNGIAVTLLILLQGCLWWGGQKSADPDRCGVKEAALLLNAKKPRWDNDRLIFKQQKGGTNQIVFFADSRRAELNGTLIWLNAAPFGAARSRNWRILREDLTNTIHAAWTTPPAFTNRLVMLDPGHGGRDEGATSDDKRLVEKDLTLDLAQRVRTLLESRGVRVLMTRTDDTTLTLADRSQLASFHHPALFVSIHLNKAANTNSFGAETFIMPAPNHPGTAAESHPDAWRAGNAFDPQSARLAYFIQHRMAPLTGGDRGLKRARFHVLANASSPAALVECGFLSNPDEAAKFQTSLHKANVARAIADAICDTLGPAPQKP